MMRLTPDAVSKIGIAAIRRAIGHPSLNIDFEIELDRDNEPQYNFRLYLPTAEAWHHASAHMLDMTDAVMADLSVRDDDHFPFIWLLSDGSWDFKRDAAAE